MTIERIPITKEGLIKLKAELRHLEAIERPQNIRAIEEARSHGDISENAEYHAAKERQSFLEVKINELETAINRSEVIEIDKGQTEKIFFGKTVELENIVNNQNVVYQLVGPYESDPENGKISVSSPLGKALLGKEAGDAVEVKTPKGVQEFEILEIR